MPRYLPLSLAIITSNINIFLPILILNRYLIKPFLLPVLQVAPASYVT